MESTALVAAQISSLYPCSQAISVVVNTHRIDVPLPPASDSEHATYSELFYTEITGTILLRVIRDGQIIELISLSTDAPPIRFIYPAPVLPNPSIVWNPAQELHILAVTTIGSLFRITVPISDGAHLWHTASMLTLSTREYVINKAKSDPAKAIVHVQGLYSVAVAYPEGSLLRLELEQLGEGNENGAHIFATSFKLTLTVSCVRSVVRASSAS